ncbi:vacuolar protein sorting-associated protein, partial [Toxoplasma gondii TgCatPRC2]
KAADEEAQILWTQKNQQLDRPFLALSVLLRAAGVELVGARTERCRGRKGVSPVALSEDCSRGETASFSKCSEDRKETPGSPTEAETKQGEAETFGDGRGGDRCFQATQERKLGERSVRRHENQEWDEKVHFRMGGTLREMRIHLVYGDLQTRVRVGLRDIAVVHQRGCVKQRLVYRQLTLERPLLLVSLSRILVPGVAGEASVESPSAALRSGGTPTAFSDSVRRSQFHTAALASFLCRDAASSPLSPHTQGVPTPAENDPGALRPVACPVSPTVPGGGAHSPLARTLVNETGEGAGSSEVRLVLRHFVCVYAQEAAQDVAVLASEVQNSLRWQVPSYNSPRTGDSFPGLGHRQRGAIVEEGGKEVSVEMQSMPDREDKTLADAKSTEGCAEPPGSPDATREKAMAPGGFHPSALASGANASLCDLSRAEASHRPAMNRMTPRHLLLRSRERLKALSLSTKYFIQLCAPTVVLPTRTERFGEAPVVALHLGEIHVYSVDSPDGPQKGALCQPSSLAEPFFVSPAGAVCSPAAKAFLRSPATGATAFHLVDLPGACGAASMAEQAVWPPFSSSGVPRFQTGSGEAIHRPSSENVRKANAVDTRRDEAAQGLRMLVGSRVRHFVVLDEFQVHRYSSLVAFTASLDALKTKVAAGREHRDGGDTLSGDEEEKRGTTGAADEKGDEKPVVDGGSAGEERTRDEKRLETQDASSVRRRLSACDSLLRRRTEGLCLLDRVGMCFAVDITSYQVVDLRALILPAALLPSPKAANPVAAASSPDTSAVAAVSGDAGDKVSPDSGPGGTAAVSPVERRPESGDIRQHWRSASSPLESDAEPEETSGHQSIMLVKGVLPTVSLHLSSVALDSVFRAVAILQTPVLPARAEEAADAPTAVPDSPPSPPSRLSSASSVSKPQAAGLRQRSLETLSAVSSLQPASAASCVHPERSRERREDRDGKKGKGESSSPSRSPGGVSSSLFIRTTSLFPSLMATLTLQRMSIRFHCIDKPSRGSSGLSVCRPRRRASGVSSGASCDEQEALRDFERKGVVELRTADVSVYVERGDLGQNVVLQMVSLDLIEPQLPEGHPDREILQTVKKKGAAEWATNGRTSAPCLGTGRLTPGREARGDTDEVLAPRTKDNETDSACVSILFSSRAPSPVSHAPACVQRDTALESGCDRLRPSSDENVEGGPKRNQEGGVQKIAETPRTRLQVSIRSYVCVTFRPDVLSSLVLFLKQPAPPAHRNLQTGGAERSASPARVQEAPSRSSPGTSAVRSEQVGGVPEPGDTCDADGVRGSEPERAGASRLGDTTGEETGAVPPSSWRTTVSLTAPEAAAIERELNPLDTEIGLSLEGVQLIWVDQVSQRHFAVSSFDGAEIGLSLRPFSTDCHVTLQNFTLSFLSPADARKRRSQAARRRTRAKTDRSPGPLEPRESPSLSTARPDKYDGERTEARHGQEDAGAGDAGGCRAGTTRHRMPKATQQFAPQLATKIVGLLPGQPYVLRVNMRSVHPSLPSFSGHSLLLKVDMGSIELVYLHKKFWKVFDWILDPFISILTASPSDSAPVPPPPTTVSSRRPASPRSPVSHACAPSLTCVDRHNGVLEFPNRGLARLRTLLDFLSQHSRAPPPPPRPHPPAPFHTEVSTGFRESGSGNAFACCCSCGTPFHSPRAAAYLRQLRLLGPLTTPPLHLLSYDVTIRSPVVFVPGAVVSGMSPDGSGEVPPGSRRASAPAENACGEEGRREAGAPAMASSELPDDRGVRTASSEFFWRSQGFCDELCPGVELRVGEFSVRNRVACAGERAGLLDEIRVQLTKMTGRVAWRQLRSTWPEQETASRKSTETGEERAEDSPPEQEKNEVVLQEMNVLVTCFRGLNQAARKVPHPTWLRVEIDDVPLVLSPFRLQLLFALLNSNILHNDPDVVHASSPPPSLPPLCRGTGSAVSAPRRSSRSFTESSSSRLFDLSTRSRERATSRGRRHLGKETSLDADVAAVEPRQTTVDWFRLLDAEGICSLRFEVFLRNLIVELVTPPARAGVAKARTLKSEVTEAGEAVLTEPRLGSSVDRDLLIEQNENRRASGNRRQSRLGRRWRRNDAANDALEKKPPHCVFHAKTMTVEMITVALPPFSPLVSGAPQGSQDISGPTVPQPSSEEIWLSLRSSALNLEHLGATLIAVRLDTVRLFNPAAALPFNVILSDTRHNWMDLAHKPLPRSRSPAGRLAKQAGAPNGSGDPNGDSGSPAGETTSAWVLDRDSSGAEEAFSNFNGDSEIWFSTGQKQGSEGTRCDIPFGGDPGAPLDHVELVQPAGIVQFNGLPEALLFPPRPSGDSPALAPTRRRDAEAEKSERQLATESLPSRAFECGGHGERRPELTVTYHSANATLRPLRNFGSKTSFSDVCRKGPMSYTENQQSISVSVAHPRCVIHLPLFMQTFDFFFFPAPATQPGKLQSMKHSSRCASSSRRESATVEGHQEPGAPPMPVKVVKRAEVNLELTNASVILPGNCQDSRSALVAMQGSVTLRKKGGAAPPPSLSGPAALGGDPEERNPSSEFAPESRSHGSRVLTHRVGSRAEGGDRQGDNAFSSKLSSRRRTGLLTRSSSVLHILERAEAAATEAAEQVGLERPLEFSKAAGTSERRQDTVYAPTDEQAEGFTLVRIRDATIFCCRRADTLVVLEDQEARGGPETGRDRMQNPLMEREERSRKGEETTPCGGHVPARASARASRSQEFDATHLSSSKHSESEARATAGFLPGPRPYQMPTSLGNSEPLTSSRRGAHGAGLRILAAGMHMDFLVHKREGCRSAECVRSASSSCCLVTPSEGDASDEVREGPGTEPGARRTKSMGNERHILDQRKLSFFTKRPPSYVWGRAQRSQRESCGCCVEFQRVHIRVYPCSVEISYQDLLLVANCVHRQRTQLETQQQSHGPEAAPRGRSLNSPTGASSDEPEGFPVTPPASRASAAPGVQRTEEGMKKTEEVEKRGKHEAEGQREIEVHIAALRLTLLNDCFGSLHAPVLQLFVPSASLRHRDYSVRSWALLWTAAAAAEAADLCTRGGESSDRLGRASFFFSRFRQEPPEDSVTQLGPGLGRAEGDKEATCHRGPTTQEFFDLSLFDSSRAMWNAGSGFQQPSLWASGATAEVDGCETNAPETLECRGVRPRMHDQDALSCGQKLVTCGALQRDLQSERAAKTPAPMLTRRPTFSYDWSGDEAPDVRETKWGEENWEASETSHEVLTDSLSGDSDVSSLGRTDSDSVLSLFSPRLSGLSLPPHAADPCSVSASVAREDIGSISSPPNVEGNSSEMSDVSSLSSFSTESGSEEIESSPPPERRYRGIFLSSPCTSPIEINVSHVLLRTLLSALTQWRSDFLRHALPFQRSSGSATAAKIKDPTGTRGAKKHVCNACEAPGQSTDERPSNTPDIMQTTERSTAFQQGFSGVTACCASPSTDLCAEARDEVKEPSGDEEENRDEHSGGGANSGENSASFESTQTERNSEANPQLAFVPLPCVLSPALEGERAESLPTDAMPSSEQRMSVKSAFPSSSTGTEEDPDLLQRNSEAKREKTKESDMSTSSSGEFSRGGDENAEASGDPVPAEESDGQAHQQEDAHQLEEYPQMSTGSLPTGSLQYPPSGNLTFSSGPRSSSVSDPVGPGAAGTGSGALGSVAPSPADPRRQLFIPYVVKNETGMLLHVDVLLPVEAGPVASRDATAADASLPVHKSSPYRRGKDPSDPSCGSRVPPSVTHADRLQRRNCLLPPERASKQAVAGGGGDDTPYVISDQGSEQNTDKEGECVREESLRSGREAGQNRRVEPRGRKWARVTVDPAQERALQQLHVEVGRAASYRVRLELTSCGRGDNERDRALGVPGTSGKRRVTPTSSGATLDAAVWEARRPVPIDRVGVYAQPLAFRHPVVMAPSSGADLHAHSATAGRSFSPSTSDVSRSTLDSPPGVYRGTPPNDGDRFPPSPYTGDGPCIVQDAPPKRSETPVQPAYAAPSSFPLASPLGLSRDNSFLVCRVVAEAGRKRLIVQSQVLLYNKCFVPVEVLVLPSEEVVAAGGDALCSGPGGKDSGLNSMLGTHGSRESKNEAAERELPSRASDRSARSTDEDTYDTERQPGSRLIVIPPGGSAAIPVNVCQTGRLCVRPLSPSHVFTWSRCLLLYRLWQLLGSPSRSRDQLPVLQSTASSSPVGDSGLTASSRPSVDAPARRRRAPVLDLLRCSCCCEKDNNGCPTPGGPSADGRPVRGDGGRLGPECGGFNVCVVCQCEDVVYEDIGCMQLKLAFHPPVSIASTLPFRVNCRLESLHPIGAGKIEDSQKGDVSSGICCVAFESRLRLSQQVHLHKLPLAGVIRLEVTVEEGKAGRQHASFRSAPLQIHPIPTSLLLSAQAAAAIGADRDAGSDTDDDDFASGSKGPMENGAEAVAELICRDPGGSRHPLRLLLFFQHSTTPGAPPSLLLHTPMWLVSFLKGAAAFMRAHSVALAEAHAARHASHTVEDIASDQRSSSQIRKSVNAGDKQQSSSVWSASGLSERPLTREITNDLQCNSYRDAEYYYVTDGSLVEDESTWAAAAAAVSSAAVNAAAVAAAAVAAGNLADREASSKTLEGDRKASAGWESEKRRGTDRATKLEQLLRRVAGEGSELCVDEEGDRIAGVYALDYKADSFFIHVPSVGTSPFLSVRQPIPPDCCLPVLPPTSAASPLPPPRRPALDVAVRVCNAPLPLLRPVQLLLVMPFYLVINATFYPISIRQSRCLVCRTKGSSRRCRCLTRVSIPLLAEHGWASVRDPEHSRPDEEVREAAREANGGSDESCDGKTTQASRRPDARGSAWVLRDLVDIEETAHMMADGAIQIEPKDQKPFFWASARGAKFIQVSRALERDGSLLCDRVTSCDRGSRTGTLPLPTMSSAHRGSSPSPRSEATTSRKDAVEGERRMSTSVAGEPCGVSHSTGDQWWARWSGCCPLGTKSQDWTVRVPPVPQRHLLAETSLSCGCSYQGDSHGIKVASPSSLPLSSSGLNGASKPHPESALTPVASPTGHAEEGQCQTEEAFAVAFFQRVADVRRLMRADILLRPVPRITRLCHHHRVTGKAGECRTRSVAIRTVRDACEHAKESLVSKPKTKLDRGVKTAAASGPVGSLFDSPAASRNDSNVGISCERGTKSANKKLVSVRSSMLRLEVRDGPAGGKTVVIRDEGWGQAGNITVRNHSRWPLLLRQCMHANPVVAAAAAANAARDAADAAYAEDVSGSVNDPDDGVDDEGVELKFSSFPARGVKSNERQRDAQSGDATRGAAPSSAATADSGLDRTELWPRIGHGSQKAYVSKNVGQERITGLIEFLLSYGIGQRYGGEKVPPEGQITGEAWKRNTAYPAAASGEAQGSELRGQASQGSDMVPEEVQHQELYWRGQRWCACAAASASPYFFGPLPVLVNPDEEALMAWDDCRRNRAVEIAGLPAALLAHSPYVVEGGVSESAIMVRGMPGVDGDTGASSQSPHASLFPGAFSRTACIPPFLLCVPVCSSSPHRQLLRVPSLPPSDWIVFDVLKESLAAVIVLSQYLPLPSPPSSTATLSSHSDPRGASVDPSRVAPSATVGASAAVVSAGGSCRPSGASPKKTPPHPPCQQAATDVSLVTQETSPQQAALAVAAAAASGLSQVAADAFGQNWFSWATSSVSPPAPTPDTSRRASNVQTATPTPHGDETEHGGGDAGEYDVTAGRLSYVSPYAWTEERPRSTEEHGRGAEIVPLLSSRAGAAGAGLASSKRFDALRSSHCPADGCTAPVFDLATKAALGDGGSRTDGVDEGGRGIVRVDSDSPDALIHRFLYVPSYLSTRLARTELQTPVAKLGSTPCHSLLSREVRLLRLQQRAREAYTRGLFGVLQNPNVDGGFWGRSNTRFSDESSDEEQASASAWRGLRAARTERQTGDLGQSIDTDVSASSFQTGLRSSAGYIGFTATEKDGWTSSTGVGGLTGQAFERRGPEREMERQQSGNVFDPEGASDRIVGWCGVDRGGYVNIPVFMSPFFHAFQASASQALSAGQSRAGTSAGRRGVIPSLWSAEDTTENQSEPTGNLETEKTPRMKSRDDRQKPATQQLPYMFYLCGEDEERQMILQQHGQTPSSEADSQRRLQSAGFVCGQQLSAGGRQRVQSLREAQQEQGGAPNRSSAASQSRHQDAETKGGGPPAGHELGVSRAPSRRSSCVSSSSSSSDTFVRLQAQQVAEETALLLQLPPPPLPLPPTPDPPLVELRVCVPQLVISVVANTMQKNPLTRQIVRAPDELMLFSVDYFSFLFAASDNHQVVAAAVQDLQVDNMRTHALYPVLLQRALRPVDPPLAEAAAPLSVASGRTDLWRGVSPVAGSAIYSVSKPICELLLKRRLPLSHRARSGGEDVFYVDNFTLSIVPLSVRLDLDFVEACQKALRSLQRAATLPFTASTSDSLQSAGGPESRTDAPTGASLGGAGVVKENADFHADGDSLFSGSQPSQQLADRGSSGDGNRGMSSDEEASLGFNAVVLPTRTPTSASPDRDVALLEPTEQGQVCIPLGELIKRLSQAYRQQLLWQLSHFVASIDILGNPARSLAHMREGVRDLALHPIHAAERGDDVLEGVYKGATSFIRHTGYGFFGGLSRMAGVASDSLGALTLDDAYVNRRQQQQRRQRPRDVQEGITFGAEAFGKAVLGGITGLIEEPMKGATEEGVEGLLKGAGKGLLGLVVKPLTGVLDFAQKTAEGIKELSQVDPARRTRRRLPRLLLGQERLLVPYDEEAARVKECLNDVDGVCWSTIPFLSFLYDIPFHNLVVTTDTHLLQFRLPPATSSSDQTQLIMILPLYLLVSVHRFSTKPRSPDQKRRVGILLAIRSRKARNQSLQSDRFQQLDKPAADGDPVHKYIWCSSAETQRQMDTIVREALGR